MTQKEDWDSNSLRWIHGIRDAQYREGKGVGAGSRLKPVDPAVAVKACRRLGLKVRVGRPRRKKPVRIA